MSQTGNILVQVAEAAMLEKGFLPHPAAAALAEAQRAQPVDRAGDGVRDLRALPWTSIDNPESQDLDQIEAAEVVDGGTRLYVGIADVDHFVAPGSAIDRYAANNTTSVYTGVRTFPMLPERLSFHLSSLVAQEVRLAIVIETLIHADGGISDAVFYPALVENKGKLDYPSVSSWLDGHAPPPGPLSTEPTLRAQVQLHDELARALADARRREGAIDVDTGEARPVVDQAGQVTGLVAHHQDRAGRVIEELMIASNRGIARALDKAGLASIRRVVKQPERWARIVAYAAERGSTLPPTPSSLALSRFIDEMRRTRAGEFSEIHQIWIAPIGRGRVRVLHRRQPEVADVRRTGRVRDVLAAPHELDDRQREDLESAGARRAVALSRAGAGGDCCALHADGGAGGEGRAARAEIGGGAVAQARGRQCLLRHHHRRWRQGNVRARPFTHRGGQAGPWRPGARRRREGAGATRRRQRAKGVHRLRARRLSDRSDPRFTSRVEASVWSAAAC